MSTKSTFPIGEISDVQCSTEPPSISFRHQGQEYWIYLGNRHQPKDVTQALLMYGELLRCSSVTIYDSGTDSNGVNVLSSISVRTEKPPGPDTKLYGKFTELMLLALFVGLVVIALRSAFSPMARRSRAEQMQGDPPQE